MKRKETNPQGQNAAEADASIEALNKAFGLDGSAKGTLQKPKWNEIIDKSASEDWVIPMIISSETR